MRKTFLAVLAAPAIMLTAACDSPVEAPVIEEEEREIGREQHPLLLSQLGGAYGGPEAAYLQGLGESLAADAGFAGDCTFTLVNSDIVNAFAVSGCYIYVTRGLMALVNSEAELASVLGHELGHIAADHLEQQERRSFLRQLGVYAVALITESETLTRIAGGAAELFTLRFSRQHEYEADEFAIDLLIRAGYDPLAAAEMLASLARYESFQEGSGSDLHAIPEWGRTHPLTENRIDRVEEIARAANVAPAALAEGETAFLEEVDGLLYGEDPEQGFVIGRQFAHPEMRIAFEVPPGFRLTNTSAAVLIEGPGGLQGEFSGGAMPPGGLDQYARDFVEQVFGAVPDLAAAERGRVNGVPALVLPMEFQAGEDPMHVLLAAYRGPEGSAYHFLVLTPGGQLQPDRLMDMIRSFRHLSPRQAATLRPRVIDVVRVGEGQDLSGLAALMASDRPLEHFLLLNDRTAGDPLEPGELVKLVRFAAAAD